jgi:hypothetical protein
MTLAKSIRTIRFRALAGTAEVRREGLEILGRWKSAAEMQPVHQKKAGDLAEQFANWRNDEAGILRFTRQYGPLMIEAEHNGEFRFKLEEWRSCQTRFRRIWERRQRFGVGEFDGAALDGEGLGYKDGKLYYKAANLWRLVSLDLLCVPWKRLRKCKCPGCQNPYFIARHLAQKYCSDLCSWWAQRQWKLNWWNRVGKKTRRKSPRKTMAVRSHPRGKRRE